MFLESPPAALLMATSVTRRHHSMLSICEQLAQCQNARDGAQGVDIGAGCRTHPGDRCHAPLIAARWRWLTFSPRMRGEKVGAYRAPAMTATFAFRRTARMRPAAWRVPGGHDGQQGEAPGRVARSAGQ